MWKKVLEDIQAVFLNNLMKYKFIKILENIQFINLFNLTVDFVI